MRRWLPLSLIALLLVELSLPVLAEGQIYNLVAMRRKYFANCLWSMDRGRIAGQEVEGTLGGLGGSEDAVIVYDLEGRYDMLESLVGYLDTTPENRSAIFEVWADGALLQRVGPLHSGQEPEWVRVPLKGRRLMTLRIVPQRYNATHGAVWGAPRLWSDLKGEIPGSVLLNVDGQTSQTVPSSKGGKKQVAIPLPLEPGEREYRVRVKFDETTGRAEVRTSPMAPGE